MKNIAVKYRIYPNEEQKVLIHKTFGCSRFIYNQLLELHNKEYKENNKKFNKYNGFKYCNNILKNKYEWLREVDKFALERSIIALESAFINYFKHNAKEPKFKSKHSSHKSYTTCFTNNNIEVNYKLNKIKLPKLKW